MDKQEAVGHSPQTTIAMPVIHASTTVEPPPDAEADVADGVYASLRSGDSIEPIEHLAATAVNSTRRFRT